jgi:DNA-binding SARP family transcriptional activator/DNA-binding CsgD family transcriptional regulator
MSVPVSYLSVVVVGDATRIQVCGRLTVELQGRRLEDQLRGRQGRLLLSYLVLNRDRPVRRDELALAMWTEGAPAAYESLLAPPLSRLRKALGAGVLEGRAELMLILPPDARIDWEQAREAVPRSRRELEAGDARAAYESARLALEIADRGLLPGLEAPWIDERRAELADLRVEALEALAAAGRALGGAVLPEAETAARAAVQAGPFRESARVALMQILHARGNVAEALRVYEDVRVLLREELGTSPGPRLVALHEQLLRDEAPSPAAPRVAAAPPRWSATFVEREREVERLATLLAEAAQGEGHAVLVEGPPGIGKTRLLAEARRHAIESGARVLNARAGELERDFPYGVVRQLFEAAIGDPERLTGAAASAKVVFAAPGVAPVGGDASFAALHGLYWVALNLASESALVIEVDDLHWCDPPSLRFLAYLARRLEGQAILFAATVRTGEPATAPALLGEIVNDPATVHILPGPLSEAAVGELVERRLGTSPDPAFRAACHRTTGGNPLLVRQLLSALEADRIRPDAAHADVVRAIGSRAVSSSVLLRLARLPAEAAAVARAVAILGEGAELPLIASLAGLDEAHVAESMAALARIEILRREPPPGFVHPLVRDAIYHELQPGERELLHARAAATLRAAGAPLDQVAQQLLLTPRRGDAEVVALLHEAGIDALARGAPDSARAYLQRALDEPAAGVEGGSGIRRATLLLDLGRVETLTRGPDAAVHLRQAYDQLGGDLDLRVAAANALGRALLFTSSPREGAAVALEAASALPPEREDDRLGLEAFALTSVLFGALSWDDVERTVPYRRPPRTPGERKMAAMASIFWAYGGGHVDDCVNLSRQALEGGGLIDDDPNLLTLAALHPLILGDRDEALTIFDRMLADAHRRGSLYQVTGVYLWRGFTLLWRGDLVDAEELTRAAFDDAERWGYGADTLQWNAAVLASVLLGRGDTAGARQALARGPERGDLSDGARYWADARLSLLVAEQRWEQAVETAGEYARRFHHRRNPAAARWGAGRAIALDALGMRRKALESAAEELERARAWGAPSTVAHSLRVLGTIEGAEGLERLEEAVELVSKAPARLEQARCLHALALARRRAGRPDFAREPLARAHALAEVCGADALLADIRAEMLLVGVEPSLPTGVAALTETERRVASLAAAGREQREIAQELFVTPKAIEVKLGNVLRKLGASTPRELALALDA